MADLDVNLYPINGSSTVTYGPVFPISFHPLDSRAGAGPANVAPVVSNFVPSAYAEINASDTIQFDVTDDSGAFTRIIVTCTLDGIMEVVHDGDQFHGLYAGVSRRSLITNGFRYFVGRQGGWPASPTFETFAIDQQGAEAS